VTGILLPGFLVRAGKFLRKKVWGNFPGFSSKKFEKKFEPDPAWKKSGRG
jgi:hypothetical protein